MKRTVFALAILGAIIAAICILDNRYFKDNALFLSPLEIKVLRIRHDRYGEGHFGAERKNGRLHRGLDILAPAGTEVRAVKGGLCVTRHDKDGYGTYVVAYHKGGLSSLYAHLKDSCIRYPRFVRQGDVVGRTGKSGNARYGGIRPHLHFELRKNGIPFDPREVIKIKR